MNPSTRTVESQTLPTYHNIIEKITQLYKENGMTYTASKAGDITAIRKDTSTINHFMNNGWSPEEIYELARKLVYIKKDKRYANKEFWNSPTNLYYLHAQREQITHYYNIAICTVDPPRTVESQTLPDTRTVESQTLPNHKPLSKAPDWQSFLLLLDQIPNIDPVTKDYFKKLNADETETEIILYAKKSTFKKQIIERLLSKPVEYRYEEEDTAA